MTWAATLPEITDEEELHDLKMRFAAIVARDTTKKHSAALELFPGHDNRVRAYAAQSWLSCPTVLQEIDRLNASSEVGVVRPTEDQYKHELLTLAREAPSYKDKLAFHRLYAETEGYISKGGAVVNNTQINDNSVKVLRVPVYKDQEHFEAKLESQQTKLIEHARSSN